MKNAARKTDGHICKKVDPGNKPHVGGPITEGIDSVLIGGEPAAVVGCQCQCASPDPDEITEGSGSVFVCGRKLARSGDATRHGGSVASGCASVWAG
jgi:uncharacterized Zn-binding protein involved in type VI secretion